MAGESQATFSASVRKEIRETYQYRCVICLTSIETTQCAHLLDTASQEGDLQVRNEVIVYSVVQVLTLVLLSFAMQSNLAFCMKDLNGMQQ